MLSMKTNVMKDDINDLTMNERACLVYGQAWGVLKMARAVGKRKKAREMLPMMREARSRCFRRCYRCAHYLMGKCVLRNLTLRSVSLAVGCEYYLKVGK